MPKTKKLESDSGSDSGPDDRNPPPKKPKTEDGKVDDDSSKVDSKGESYWELPRNRRVSMSNFKGKVYLNIREYYMNKGTGEMCPGKAGITLTKIEWEQLLALKDKINFE